ncbi:MAG TPA: cupin domain-containing protein [Alphaproteobacteria bacterium]|jgi:quercetin dioxygenase-like cupin family protein
MKIRRIVTGHDGDGNAIVTNDAEMTNVKVMPSGNKGCLMWVTDDTPAEVEGGEDPALREMGIAPPPRGTAFRILELAPGKEAFMHRTDTLDFCIVLAGECVMRLDGENEVALGAGDVLVQRGTWHGWENRSDRPCRLAFVLIGAKPPARHLHGAH